ncbi:ABC transporter family substrate-binding protein [Streptomyces sp. NPDC004609]|uniref:ABC transporter family substrate-binding protein n=1 Tax=Streptomyces sp. NPDC004609 TaxID=3364704 RepID=UPI0036BE74F9
MAQARTSKTLRTRKLRSVALLTSGVLTVPALAGCGADESERTGQATAQDIAATPRDRVGDGGSLSWAVDAMPTTLNAFQADADGSTTRIAGAVLPALFTLDKNGRPQRNPDYVESAEIVEREPKQVVLYKLNQKAVWSDGREIGAPDFVAQWRALNGRNSAYWTARNAGYERIEKIQKGANDLQVKVTFAKPYADWQSLFTPLYPKDVTGTPDAFNDGARTGLKATAGPFQLDAINRKDRTATLVRNPRWWGDQAKLERLVLTAVPRDKRAAALADGRVDIAEVDRSAADRITLALRHKGTGGSSPAHGPAAAQPPSAALRTWAMANGSDEEQAQAALAARERTAKAIRVYGTQQAALRSFVVRKSLEPAYTQLALNGETGPLSDDRVRRAVARALDRKELAETVLRPLGLPATPPGSHLALAGQRAYTDNSGALGEQNTQEAQALLADAGWTPGGALKKPAPAKAGGEVGAPGNSASPSPSEAEDDKNKGRNDGGNRAMRAGPDAPSADGLYIVGDEKAGSGKGADGSYVLAPAPVIFEDLSLQPRADSGGGDGAAAAEEAEGAKSTEGAEGKRGATGAYAPAGTAAPVAAGGRLGKDGKPLSLRLVLPSGPGSEPLRAVGEKIARMLDRIGVRTQITKVSDESYFKDHVASGNYDLALYSWPATAYPATDARPIYSKPEPASDGSLLVEQNYTRVGTDYIDQLFDQAASELDEEEARELVRRADARIWAAAGSIPLYQRPELVAVRSTVLNAGAFGFAAPRYQDVGFKKSALRKAVRGRTVPGASARPVEGAGAAGAGTREPGGSTEE